MKKTKETKLQKREREILQLIDSEDRLTICAFDLIRMYFFMDDMINNKNHSQLINLIYVDRKELTKWAQANYCNISHRTAFRYRNLYIKLFDHVNDEEKIKDCILLCVSSINLVA